MDKQLNELMQDSLKKDYFGCLVADKHGLCLGVKGTASRRSSGIITAIMNEVKKLEPLSSPPVVVIENVEHMCLINQDNSITTALYKNKSNSFS